MTTERELTEALGEINDDNALMHLEELDLTYHQRRRICAKFVTVFSELLKTMDDDEQLRRNLADIDKRIELNKAMTDKTFKEFGV